MNIFCEKKYIFCKPYEISIILYSYYLSLMYNVCNNINMGEEMFMNETNYFLNGIYCDSHLHITDLREQILVPKSQVCSSVHSLEEFSNLRKIQKKTSKETISISYGVHPQNPDIKLLEDLQHCLVNNTEEISAIGEAGFDFFTTEYSVNKDAQEEVWLAQIELAIAFHKPLIIHCRKGIEKIFRDSNMLSKLPAVLFHSFPGSLNDANSIRRHNINGYFSFCKQICNNNKKSIECVKKLPKEWLLFETDAPYQTLKDEEFTVPVDIKRVYEEATKIRGCSLEELQDSCLANFQQIFK